MSELEDKINSILSNPEELEKITSIAKSIMGSDSGSDEQSPRDGGGASPAAGLDLGGLDLGSIDPQMIASLGRLMSRVGVGSEKHALLEAMKPYLSHRRREKMERAIQIAKIAKLAGAAFSEFGGGS